MEITKTGKFYTQYCGSAPSLGVEEVLKLWIETRQDKALLSMAESKKKKGETALDALPSILSIFHRDDEGNPIIGGWMLQRCLMVTGLTIFNAQKNKEHPTKDQTPKAIIAINPVHINLFNGDKITSPDGVSTHTVSKKEGAKTRSFFKAYEFIKAGATFTATMYFDENLMSEKCIEELLSNCGLFGLGAFRERFGKFKWIG